MKNWVDLFYFFMIGASLMLSMQGLWFTAIMPGIDRWSMRFFRILFVVLILLCLLGFIETVMNYFNIVPVAGVHFVMSLESVLLSLPIPMMTAYLLHCCGESVRNGKILHIASGLWIVFLVMIAIAPFINSFYYITPDMNYYRGPWYPLLLTPVNGASLITLIAVIRRRRLLSRKEYQSFLIALIPTTIALFVQMFIEIYPLIDISIVFSVMVMYSLILSDHIERDLGRQREIARQQQEIANQRTSIMVLQMRPHFIYNTMTSIYCLCKQNPDLAQRVTLDFTTYIRKNFTAIASSEPIPFSSELEHTRAYLAVEQASYEDSLSIDYDIQYTCFRVPPLTLQPIVENSIKHGRNPYAGVFRISIQTKKTESGSEIIVSDNGRGFEHVDDSKPHIALKNIQQRLEIICGGCLMIASGEGGGTVVTVTVPDKIPISLSGKS